MNSAAGAKRAAAAALAVFLTSPERATIPLVCIQSSDT
jgi:hypothetical protein